MLDGGSVVTLSFKYIFMSRSDTYNLKRVFTRLPTRFLSVF